MAEVLASLGVTLLGFVLGGVIGEVFFDSFGDGAFFGVLAVWFAVIYGCIFTD